MTDTDRPRHPRPPMRFPGTAGSVPARDRPRRRWILGHCKRCELPLVVAGAVDSEIRAWPAVKSDNDTVHALLERTPDWPVHGTWLAAWHPREPDPPAGPWDLTCGGCGTVHGPVTPDEAAALAERAIRARAPRFIFDSERPSHA